MGYINMKLFLCLILGCAILVVGCRQQAPLNSFSSFQTAPLPPPAPTPASTIRNTLCIGGETYLLTSNDEFNQDQTLDITDSGPAPGQGAGTHMWSSTYSYGRTNLKGIDDSYYPSSATLASWGAPPVLQLIPGKGLEVRAYPVPAAHANDAATVCSDGTCRHYLAGLLTSQQAFVNGYWEFKAEVPAEERWWPALWLLNESNSGAYNENDVLEIFGNSIGQGAVQQTIVSNNSQNVRATISTAATQMHIYATLETPNYVGYYIDGVPTSKRLGRPAATTAMNPIINLESCTASSFCAPGAQATDTASMTIEHYRYYAPMGTACSNNDLPAIPQ